MLKFKEYACPETLEEAYGLVQKKRNIVLGGMLWLKLQDRTVGTVIDLQKLGLDTITEDEENYYIGSYVTLRDLEIHEGLNTYTKGAIAHAVEHIIGIQFRNCATVGGSIFGCFGFSDVLTVFLALGAKVELYKNGIVSVEEFINFPRPLQDILVRIILPKNVDGAVYMSTRNSATDFPSLTCAVAKVSGEYRVSIGARPMLATLVTDEQGILKDGITKESAESFGEYVASKVTFGSNMIAKAEYRQKVCKVLVRRCLNEL